jgi:hypothetical protein
MLREEIVSSRITLPKGKSSSEHQLKQPITEDCSALTATGRERRIYQSLEEPDVHPKGPRRRMRIRKVDGESE